MKRVSGDPIKPHSGQILVISGHCPGTRGGKHAPGDADIIASVDALDDEAVSTLSELVRHDSTLGKEASAQDCIAGVFAALGPSIDRLEIDLDAIENRPGFSPVNWRYEGKTNLVAIHQPRRTTGRSLTLNGQIDVVPTGPVDIWTDPPFEPVVRGGRLYGRGSGCASGLLRGFPARRVRITERASASRVDVHPA